eukprot:9500862-Pyramimonas_sp.AAC.1
MPASNCVERGHAQDMVGAWITNIRMQRQAGCINGCEGASDRISHYVCACPRPHHPATAAR